MGPRFVARVCAAALLVVPVAACGEETGNSPDGSDGTTAAASSDLTEGRWLVRLTGVAGQRDGEDQQARYAWVTPDTGDLEVIEGQVFSESAAGRETTLLVDAGRRWAVSASMAQADGTAPQLIDLESGTSAPLEVGLEGLRAWSFDPEQPGMLRVVQDSGEVSLVDLGASPATVTPEGTLTVEDGEYGYYFDADTGQPYVVSLGPGPNRPEGLGDQPEQPVPVDGGELVFADPELPAGACALNAAFRRTDGAETAFCANGRKLTVHTRAAGAASYTKAATLELGFVADGLDFVLPPLG